MKGFLLAFASLAATASVLAVGEGQAAACGGCFHPPPTANLPTSDITDERMLLTVSPQQTTLYDEILYSGNPTSFAWVLPVRGTVQVGLSADVLFAVVDALTGTIIDAPAGAVCPPPPCTPHYGYGDGAGGGNGGGGCGSSMESAASVPAFNSAAGKAAGDTSEPPPPPVTVTKQESVGPYETVQLSSTDPMALEAWLAANGYEVPAAVQPIIAQYITEGFDFLAMKLQPGQGVQAMRPVRVTTTGAGLSLPLRMASIGTGATVGITIWVVSDGRYEPKNFPFFHIDDTQLVWDFNVGASNYTTLRQQEEQSFQGKGWEIESALSIAQGLVTQGIATSGSSINVVSGEATTPVDASLDYLPEQDASGNVTKSADEVRTEDVAALFAGLTGPNATFTRIRSDLAHTAMTQDFVVQASPDQSELSNARSVTKYTNLSCPTYDSNCNVTGSTVLSKQVALGLGGQLAAAPAGGASAAGSASCSSARSSEPPFSIPAFATLLALAALRPRRRRQA